MNLLKRKQDLIGNTESIIIGDFNLTPEEINPITNALNDHLQRIPTNHTWKKKKSE